MLNFDTIYQLNEWLTAKGIDTTRWGMAGAKTVENLWAELVEKESQLQDDPPQRQVRIVNVMIHDGERLLVEGEQEFGANQSRYRGKPPAEKLKPGEDPVEAAFRCLQEEMGVNRNQVQILSWTEEPEQVLLDSPSYPGLTTNYMRYEVETNVKGLPRQSFTTTETAHDDGDPVKRHQWLWADL